MSANGTQHSGEGALNQILDEHEGLLALLDALDEYLRRDAPQSQLQTAFAKLTDAIGAHFQSEETLMAENDYAYLPAHRQEHAAILQDLQQVLVSSQNAASRTHFNVIKRKLMIHLQGKDRSLLQDMGGAEAAID